MYDLCIVNGRIVDGSGKTAYRGDIGIVGERIVALGSCLAPDAKEVLDGEGLVVAPGFIDAHTHDDLAIFRGEGVPMKIQQGVTTVVTGNCGFSMAPLAAEHVEALKDYSVGVLGNDAQPWHWRLTSELYEAWREIPMAQHVRPLIGQGPVRVAVMGFERRAPTEQELQQQESLVREAMEAGSAGLSLGLMYIPGMFTPTDELVRLARVVGRYGGVVTSHMRGEGDQLLASLAEMLAIAERAEVAMHISHLKVTGRKNWGSIERALDLIAEARGCGLDITVDVYPYNAGSTTITQLLPPWVLDGGIAQMLRRLREPEIQKQVARDLVHGIEGWENQVGANGWDSVLLAALHQEDLKPLEGLNMLEVAEALGKSPEEAFFHIILEEQGEATITIFHMDERDVERVVQAPFAMIGSDGIPVRGGRPHPRLYGTFPRYFRRYVREMGSLTLEEAVRKVTSLPAHRFGLGVRGEIAVGNIADLVLFDPETITDTATYKEPRTYPEGIKAVIVSGQMVVQGSQQISNRPGRLLLTPQGVRDEC
ncbi:N-acyl-D-amino-acid deacylase family protein [Ktedonospora formicarum]|uniref:Aminoacylase n=1 Tax=Ktedonospora formicarum TaxID=2778364 RepID=A0A8J3HY14_9CHLR|nr:D-aminoacylase [Ktedonospora formicarum]GHO42618.1 aminoacylase [Ktedonospora formicarum]